MTMDPAPREAHQPLPHKRPGRYACWLAPLALAAASGCGGIDPWDVLHGGGSGGASSGGAGGDPDVCVVDGVAHAVGSTFPAADGCNTCVCDDDGRVACTERACLETCGGFLGLQCSDDQFCNFSVEAQCGAADQTGVCSARPEVCTEEFEPVCGCDDVTYSNGCFAAAAGVSVVSEGECESAPGQCRVDSDCPQPACACLDLDGDGSCENHCPTLGCVDGQCVDVTPPGASCGGFLGLSCPGDQFCDFPLEAACGAADQLGSCQQQPMICTQEFDPVCGCDGETYGNACGAAAAGVSVASRGSCAELLGEGESCGGFRIDSAAQCAAGLFCQHQPGALCGAADAPGECVVIPDSCNRGYDPVCGCDGQTYGNACRAAASEMGIFETGACRE